MYYYFFYFFIFRIANAQTDCDTINFPVPNNWSGISYQAPTLFPGFYGGYINGVNWTGDLEKANFFDLSATSFTHLLGTMIKFGKANSTNSDNLSKVVYFKVYADEDGKPGALLTTAQNTLSEINKDVSAGLTTNINFSPAIPLPASKKFYVSVDISNFIWTVGGAERDSIWIAGTADDETVNTAWEFENDSTWVAYPDNWSNPNDESNPLDATLWIFPYVSSSETGCATLPVTLLSFNGDRRNNEVLLKWQVSNEINMNGYEIERADNDGIFKTIAIVKAINSLKTEVYSVTDKNAFINASTVQYRLKQIDHDGSVKYSTIITIKSSATVSNILFSNPFTGALTVQFSLSIPEKVSMNLYEIHGRLVAAERPALFSISSNIIYLNSTQNINAGTYLLEINAGNERFVYKVVKQ